MSQHSESEGRDESHPPVHEEQHTIRHGSFVPGEEEVETHEQPVGSFADMNQTTEDNSDEALPPETEGEDRERIGRFSDGPDAETDFVTRSEPEGSFDENDRGD